MESRSDTISMRLNVLNNMPVPKSKWTEMYWSASTFKAKMLSAIKKKTVKSRPTRLNTRMNPNVKAEMGKHICLRMIGFGIVEPIKMRKVNKAIIIATPLPIFMTDLVAWSLSNQVAP